MRVPDVVHLVVVGMITRELLDVAVDNHGHVVANVVGRAAGRVRSRFRQRAAPRPVHSVKRPWMKCPSRGDTRGSPLALTVPKATCLSPCRYLTTWAAFSCRSGLTIAAMCALARAFVASMSACSHSTSSTVSRTIGSCLRADPQAIIGEHNDSAGLGLKRLLGAGYSPPRADRLASTG